MTRYRFLAFTCVALVLTPLAAGARQQSSDAAAGAMQEMMERMAEVAKLGDRHADLGRYVGTWDVELALVMPGVPRQASKGTAEYAWVIEGRWLGQSLKGQLMGGPYESYSILGFDNFAKNHVVVTVNSVDTSMLISRGLVVDPTHKVRTLYGTLDEYATDELHKPYKVVGRDLDADHHVLEIWDLGIGESGAKVLEFTFTRRR